MYKGLQKKYIPPTIISCFLLILFSLTGCSPVQAHAQQVAHTKTAKPSVKLTKRAISKAIVVPSHRFKWPTPTPTPTPVPVPVVIPTPTPIPVAIPTEVPTTTTAGTSLEDTIAQDVFQAINTDRAKAGLAPLTWSQNLVNSAHAHNLAMQNANQLSHQLPGEAGLGDRETAAGVNWTWAAENIGVTSDQTANGALGLHQAMMGEQPPDDGHRQNILTTSGNHIGVDVVIDSTHGSLWLTEDFANA